jgi:hypothetical protein
MQHLVAQRCCRCWFPGITLRSWMECTLRLLSKKSETAGAIRYALSH